MEENQESHAINAHNELLKGRRGLKAMLEQSESILKKHGGPTFLKNRSIIEVEAQALTNSNEYDDVRDQLEKHEEKMESIRNEMQLVLASIKAQKTSNRPWILTLAAGLLALAFFISGVFWQKNSNSIPPLMASGTTEKIEVAQLKPRSNLREGPTLQSKILTVVSEHDQVLYLKSQGDWVQVMVKNANQRPDSFGWVHKSNVITQN